MVDTVAEPAPVDEPPIPPRRRRTAAWIALGVAVVLAALVVIFARSEPATDTASTPLLGRPAPIVTGTTLDGQGFDLGALRGNWVVLNFFGTWCPPCLQEHPELVEFARRQSASGDAARLVTVTNNEPEAAPVANFFADNGGDWPVLFDPKGGVSVAFGVAKVPETWIVDPNGIVVFRTIREVTADSLTAVLERAKAGG